MSAVLLQLIRARQGQPVPEPAWRPGAAAVAVTLGITTTILMLLAFAGPINPAQTEYFAANSLPRAQGRNVVNVIIVDFRGLDTLGESTVVLYSLLAAMPILGLLVRRPARSKVREEQS
jgi:multicomponent Na+:H+ antiporter subunit A